MTRGEGDAIADNEWLTQHGTKRADDSVAFRAALRNMPGKTELDMSMIRGRVGAERAGELRLGSSRRPERDAARHALAGRFRAAGFRVEHTPRYPRTPWHVSIFWDHGEWDSDVAKLFNSCFGEEG